MYVRFEINIEEFEGVLNTSKEEIQEFLKNIHPADCVTLMRDLTLDEQIKLITSSSPQFAGQILSQLQDISFAEEFLLVEKLPLDVLIPIIEVMPTDNAVDALHTFKKSTVSEILYQLNPERSEALEEMLRFSDESAGGLMTDDFISLPENMTVANAISELKKYKTGEIVLSAYRYIYITDSEERLIGMLPIVDLLIHPDTVLLKNIMKPEPLSVGADIDQEEVANIFTKYDLDVIPVLNRGRRIIGRITVDDVINVINEEADKDIYKLVGTDDIEKSTPSSIKIASIRLPWILASLLGSLIYCTVIKLFSL